MTYQSNLWRRGERRRHSITEVVGVVYCEKKLVFDHAVVEDVRPLDVKAKAALGTVDHYRFELEGRAEAMIDKRCFIASAVYGGDAPETAFLRQWRDEILMPKALGRWLVRIYYTLSPTVVPMLQRSEGAKALVRAVLDAVMRVLKRGRT